MALTAFLTLHACALLALYRIVQPREDVGEQRADRGGVIRFHGETL
jgi:hypothetical protein